MTALTHKVMSGAVVSAARVVDDDAVAIADGSVSDSCNVMLKMWQVAWVKSMGKTASASEAVMTILSRSQSKSQLWWASVSQYCRTRCR